MSKKFLRLTAFILTLTASVSICSAAIGPITSITTDNPPGSPPYNILSITVGNYTVAADRLGTGTTTHGGIGGTPCPEMDDWDINTALNWNLGGGNYWTVNFGGTLWKDSNGDNPDFFLFESGGDSGDDPDIAPIFPDGTVGTAVDMPATNWGGTGYNRVAAVANDAVDMNGQQLHGLCFSITDLQDASGNPLTNETVILGLWISDRGGADPVGFFAVVRPPVQASDPTPANGATDVPRDMILGWEPGQSAQTHDVYFGTAFADVNDASRTDQRDVLVRQGQNANTYDPDGLLEFGQTYYWRIDEVSAPPDSTVYKGEVWSFTTEPVGYPIDGANITPTASSVSEAIFGPEKTIDGSGLDENSLHSIEPTDMWLSANEPQGAWIQYELDKLYKLYEMWVWNSNQIFESLFGFGMKDVTVEYSTDGITWTALTDVPEFTRASGAADYAHDTIVDFGGAVAKFVRLTASSNWGGVLPQFGLSEVRIFYIPVSAREPSPESGAIDVNPTMNLAWRAGREAATHKVYLSTDKQVVIDGTVSAVNMSEASYSAALDLASTYYWRVDEVNDIETPTTWQGDVWSLSTSEYLVVDDFESYNDIDPPDPESHRIFESWGDGFGVATNGALIGYDPPQPSYTETTIVHSGTQSLPLFYSNIGGGATYSETARTFAPSQNWAQHGIQTLVVHFHGTPGNTGQLYLRLNDVKVPYPGNSADITRPIWKPWNIDLASLGVNLQSITTLALGIDGSGAAGTLYIDDILLYRSAPVVASEEIWVEAESATTLGPRWRSYDDPGASGGRHIGSEDGDGDDNNDPPGTEWVATYNFTASGGVYRILARIITSPGNSFWIRIQGATSQQITRADGWVNTNPMDMGDTWHWDEFHNDAQDDNVVDFTLEAGQHTLEIAKREDGTMLDAIVIFKID